MDYSGRMRRAQQSLENARLDALIVTHLPNVRYLCGFTGSAAILVITERGSLLFSDGRYSEQAREEVRGARIRILKGKSALAGALEWLSNESRLKRVGIEPAHLSVAERDTLAGSIGRGARLVSAPPIIDRMRMVKDEAEIDLIRKACHLGVGLFSRLQQVARAGASETGVAGELEFAAREAGAEQMAFTTIIAGGARSALPHGGASAAKLRVKI